MDRWPPVLGYDSVDTKLVVNRVEATQVTAIFEAYIENPSLTAVDQELNRRGWWQKSWTTTAGKTAGGGKWNRHSLRTLLTNPRYVGKQKLGSETFDGEHAAIVIKRLLDGVQRLMNDGYRIRPSNRGGDGYTLRGLIRCSSCETSMVPSWTRRRQKLYRYYLCSHAEKNGHASCVRRR